MKTPHIRARPGAGEEAAPGAHVEGDFAARWRAAGATPDELDELRTSLTNPIANPPSWIDESTGRYSKQAFRDLRARAELRKAKRQQWRLVFVVSPVLLGLAFMLGLHTAPGLEQPASSRRASPAAEQAPDAPSSSVALSRIEGHQIRAFLSQGATLKQTTNGVFEITQGAGAVWVEQIAHGDHHHTAPTTQSTPQPKRNGPLHFAIGDHTLITSSAIFAVSDDASSIRVYAGAATLVSPDVSPIDITPTTGFLLLGGAAAAAKHAVRGQDTATMDALAQRLTTKTPITQADETPSSTRAPEIDAYVRALDLLRREAWSAAADAFAQYLQTYPNGVLLDEAELSRIEALAHCGDRGALTEAATEWLEKHANHPRAGEIRSLLEAGRSEANRRPSHRP
ncbi:MAG: hypothetical protein IPK13_01485 [Deltaproteobacteria bacterium]|nr:hypothetical protein [Deltaproteobacteria bacterium]